MPSVGLESGQWTDVSVQGQFLMDLEFLMRYCPRSGTASCVYCKSPSYLALIAQHFPWIHFYVFEHRPPMPEYNPENPAVTAVPLTIQVEFNKTMSHMEFTKEMARTMGERSARDRESLLMICHSQDSIRQLALHVLMRPNFSLMDIAGLIPKDYLDGELVLPMYIPNNKIFLGLVSHQSAKCKSYDPEIMQGELGFFQAVVRVTKAYDEASKDLIIGDYARQSHQYHRCSFDVVKNSLLSTLDLLWAEASVPPIHWDQNAVV
jgi:hypothetical protein